MSRLVIEFVLVIVVCVASTLAIVKTIEVKKLGAEASAANRKARKAVEAAAVAGPGHHGKAGADAHAVHWTYEEGLAPSRWGDAFPVCSAGKAQSPIDIRGPFEKDSRVLKTEYRPSPLKILNNGHTLQVNVAAGSSLTVGGEKFELLQFHFHRPSEEHIDGKPSAMVAHLVHKSATGKLAVIGVLLNEGKDNPLIASIWAAAPRTEGPEVVVANATIDVAALLPTGLDFYAYEGSLTTPPCSEGVTFFILKNPASIGRSQVDAFPFKANARPLQPLNGRKVATN